MASSPQLEMNTNLPGVRLLQQWIREKRELSDDILAKLKAAIEAYAKTFTAE